LALSPFIWESIGRLAQESAEYVPESHAGRLARVTLDELAAMPQALVSQPDDRSTLGEWAKRLALSERSMSRLLIKETGLTFGRWRQQLHLVVALRELASGKPVQNVAGALGYESVNAFITMFKKAMCSTPAQYFSQRKNML
jgi:AraC-like DNA-binding protein